MEDFSKDHRHAPKMQHLEQKQGVEETFGGRIRNMFGAMWQRRRRASTNARREAEVKSPKSKGVEQEEDSLLKRVVQVLDRARQRVHVVEESKEKMRARLKEQKAQSESVEALNRAFYHFVGALLQKSAVVKRLVGCLLGCIFAVVCWIVALCWDLLCLLLGVVMRGIERVSSRFLYPFLGLLVLMIVSSVLVQLFARFEKLAPYAERCAIVAVVVLAFCVLAPFAGLILDVKWWRFGVKRKETLWAEATEGEAPSEEKDVSKEGEDAQKTEAMKPSGASSGELGDPIEHWEEDRYGMALSAAEILCQLFAPEKKDARRPLVRLVGVSGAWGSGKTSFVRIMMDLTKRYLSGTSKFVQNEPWNAMQNETFKQIKKKLEAIKDTNVTFIHFSCLDVLQGESIISSLFRELKTKEGEPYTRVDLLMETLPEVDGIALSNLWQPVRNWIAKKNQEKLKAQLKEGETTYVMVIDDVERLPPKDALKVLQELSRVYRFPKLKYLFLYDEAQLALSIGLAQGLEHRQDCEDYGRRFLEKILAYHRTLPALNLNAEIIDRLVELREDLREDGFMDKEDLFLKRCGINKEVVKCLAYGLEYPRDVALFFDSLHHDLKSNPELTEVNLSDALLLRLFQRRWPGVYAFFKDHYSMLFQSDTGSNDGVFISAGNWSDESREQRRLLFRRYLKARDALSEEKELDEIEQLLDMLFHKKKTEKPEAAEEHRARATEASKEGEDFKALECALNESASVALPRKLESYFNQTPDILFAQKKYVSPEIAMLFLDDLKLQEKIKWLLDGDRAEERPALVDEIYCHKVQGYKVLMVLRDLVQMEEYNVKFLKDESLLLTACCVNLAEELAMTSEKKDENPTMKGLLRLFETGASLPALYRILTQFQSAKAETLSLERIKALRDSYLARILLLTPPKTLETCREFIERRYVTCLVALRTPAVGHSKRFWEILANWFAIRDTPFAAYCALICLTKAGYAGKEKGEYEIWQLPSMPPNPKSLPRRVYRELCLCQDYWKVHGGGLEKDFAQSAVAMNVWGTFFNWELSDVEAPAREQ